MSKTKRRIAGIVNFVNGIGERRIWTFAAAATFYLFLSLVPIIVLVCALLPYTPLTQDLMLQILDDVVPNSLYALVKDIVGYVYAGSAFALSISAVITVWSASLSILAIMRGMDAAYDVKRRENFIIFRLRACFFMLIMLASILLTLCAIVYGQMILDVIRSTLHESWAINLLFFLLKYGRYAVVMLFLYIVFQLFYKWLPAGRRKFFWQWPGALFTTVAWTLFSIVFSLYNSFSNKYSIYGILGTVIIAMLWVYYCMFFLLFGAYINKFVEIKRDEKLKHLAEQLIDEKKHLVTNQTEDAVEPESSVPDKETDNSKPRTDKTKGDARPATDDEQSKK